MIDIKDIQGNVMLSVPVTQSCQKVEELMGTDHIQLSWNSEKSETLPLGSFIEHEGERYSLLEPYSPSQKNEVEYTYTPQFKSRVMAWGKMPFFFYSGESKEPDWTLTSNPADFMRCICDAILNETGDSWSYSIDASLPASASLSFTSVDILSGLNQIAGAFETEWFADKKTKTLYLGLLSHGESVTLEVGKNINVPSVQGSREGYYTRFYAFGSTRNITQDYEGSNTNNLVNKRLTLDPAKYPNGYKDIREGLGEGEIFPKVLIFDEVYPSAKLSISGVRNRLMYRLDTNGDRAQVGTDDEGNPIYDQYAIWYFRIEGFGFDVSNIIEGYKLSVSFQSGALQGREFELKYYEKDTEISTSDGLKFEAKAGDYEILFVEEGSLILPSMTGLVPSDGDSVILFNIKMPTEYTQSAYSELEEKLDKEITRMTSDLNNYSFKSNPIAFNENNPNLSVGQKVTYINGSYSYTTRVMKLTTQLDFPIEQEITIGNQKVKGNTQQLKEEVASANKDLNLLAVFNDMTQSIQQSYNRTQQMMLEGFAAIKNIWQFRETENGERYAWSAFPVVTQQGITMYADGTNLNLPSIYAGLPIDNSSIYWDEIENEDGTKKNVLKAKVGTGEGGSAVLIGDLGNVGTWANELASEDRIMVQKKDSDQWTSLSLEELGTASFENVKDSGEGNAYTAIELSEDKKTLTLLKGETFATKKEHDELDTKVKDFLEGSDTDGIINKWKELETFLDGMKESDDLAEILSGKADKETIDEEFKKYVTLGGNETITGAKDFTGGLSVNGSPIVYKDGHWLFTGDFLVTGAITMFANEGTYKPSTIMDAISVDGTTIMNDGKKLYLNPNLDLGGGGLDDVKVTGSGNAITSASLSNNVLTLTKGSTFLTSTDLTSWTGSSKITTLGTITTGTWHGSKIANAYLANSSITINGASTSLGSSVNLYIGRTLAQTSEAMQHLTGIGNITPDTGSTYTLGTSSVPWKETHTKNAYVDGIRLYKSQSGVLFLEGNLVVSGGITMFGTNSVTASTVMDGVNVDGTTIIKSGGKLMLNPDLELGGGLDEGALASYLSTNKYLTQTTGDARYITAIGTNGNYLTYTKNGTTQNVTVPYATNSDKLDGLDSTDFIKVNGMLTSNVNFNDYYTSGSYNNNTGNGSGNSNIPDSYGLMLVFGDKGGYAAQLHIGSSADFVKIRTRYYRDGSMSWVGWYELVVASKAHTITPQSTNAYNLGSSSYKWANVYATTFNGALSGNAATATTATTASKLSTVSKTAWGQTYWTSGGVPETISGDISNVGNVTPTSTNAHNLGSSNNVWLNVYSNRTHGTATASKWEGGMTANNAAFINDTTNSSNSYHPILYMKSYSGHVLNFGGYVDTFGFYGFYSGRTENNYDWRTYWDTSTGDLYHSKAMTVTGKLTAGSFSANNVEFSVSNKAFISAKGWYRFATSTAANNLGGTYIFSIKRSYANSNNEAYIVSCVIDSDKVHFTQLSGHANTRLITRLRCTYTNGSTIYFDFYYNGTVSNMVYVNAIGYCTVQTPAVTTSTLTSTVTFDLGDGMIVGGNLLVKGGVTMYATSSTSPITEFYTNKLVLTETNNSAAFNEKGILFGSNGVARIGVNYSNDLGIYTGERIILRPNSLSSESSIGMVLEKTGNAYLSGGLTVGATSSNANVTNGNYKLHVTGKAYVTGTLTQNSDIRFKDIHKDLQLSLATMAEAPGFEYHFTDDERKDTHIGTSAQYWQNVDGVVSEGADGRLGMDYASLGVVMGISLAKELSRYESATDKELRRLREKVKELEHEVESLKTA